MGCTRMSDGMRAYSLCCQFGNLRRCPLGVAVNERMNTEPGDWLTTPIEEDVVGCSPRPRKCGELARRVRPEGSEALLIALAADLHELMISTGSACDT